MSDTAELDDPPTSLQTSSKQVPANGHRLRDSLRTRRHFLLAVAAGSAVVSVVGLGTSLWVKSPQQVAADAGPPKPSVISAQVERRVLTQTVVLRGKVAPGQTIEVTPAASSEGRSVISRTTVKREGRVRNGTVVAEVSGRPVIALRGRIPAYRDVRLGLKGPDIKQLQIALRALGYSVADATGTFGGSSQAAVKSLYTDRGYEPPEADVAATPQSEPSASGAGSSSSAKPNTAKPNTAEPGTTEPGTAKPKSTVYLKAGEVVFVPKFPARVLEVTAGLGTEVKGTILKLAAGELVVRGSLSPVDRHLVKVGKRVRILSEESGLQARGRVVSIGAFSDGAGDNSGGESGDPGSGQGDSGGQSGEPGHPITVEGDHPLSEKFAGQNVRLTIEAASTEGPVLVVPSSAIYAVADGSTEVERLGPNGREERIPVGTGATGGGFVEVRSDSLTERDRVVIGQ